MSASNSTTLQELCKRKYPTIKAFAQALGCSPSKAGMILQGRYLPAMSVTEMNHIAALLGVSFLECSDAMTASYDLFMEPYRVREAMRRAREEREQSIMYRIPLENVRRL